MPDGVFGGCAVHIQLEDGEDIGWDVEDNRGQRECGGQMKAGRGSFGDPGSATMAFGNGAGIQRFDGMDLPAGLACDRDCRVVAIHVGAFSPGES